MWISFGWAWEPPQTAFHIHIRHIQSVWARQYAVHWHTVTALHSYTHPTWLRCWGFGSCGVKMMWLCQCWGWQPPQTASHIHIDHIQSVWAHWYAVHWHTAAAFLHKYTHPTWLRLWGSGSLVESKWCQYIMVEADSHLNLLPTSTLDTYKVFEHIDMLSVGIQ